MLITFSGLDGAGKSTLIEWLKTALREMDHDVTVFHLNDHIGLYAYARCARDRVRGDRRPATGDRQPATSARGWREQLLRLRYRILWNKAARRWIYLLDLGIFLGYRLYVEKLRKQILVMDRYFYDTLVDLSDGRSPRFLQFLSRLTPAPTIPIFVDVSPEHAFARKGEYSVDYLAQRRLAYRRIFDGLPKPVVLENEELSKAQRALARIVSERIAAR